MGRLLGVVRQALLIGLLFGSTGLRAEIQMKSRGGQTRLLNRTSVAKSRVATRSHLILDFKSPPTADTVRTLTGRQMRAVAYMPVTGIVVGVNGEADLSGLELEGFDTFQPDDKLSRELVPIAGGTGERSIHVLRRLYFVVEFHADIPDQDRRALVTEIGFSIREHRDLAGTHMLVRGTLEQVRILAEWDEVAYIFPASGELVTGLPVIGCLGGATEAGLVGQVTQRVGDGWDGPGLNRAMVAYSLQSGVPARLGEANVLSEIQRAMAIWSGVVQVDFQRRAAADSGKNINILFSALDHADSYPFDGPGKVLAHTFYPAPPNPEPIAGDMHFDADEVWNIGSDIDLYSVALHELGHALGLGHSDVPNAVMYPYYRRVTNLTPEDIGAIRQLYASAGGSDAPPLVLNIVSPDASITTTAATAQLTGTLSGPIGSPTVSWQASPGSASGSAVLTSDAAGGYQWQIPSVPLALGTNQITVNASDASGRTVTRSVELRRDTFAVQPTPTPTPILRVDVLSPGSYSVVTTNTVAANGLISGATGAATARWLNERGGTGDAIVSVISEGIYRWSADSIPLETGSNTITLTVSDSTNRTGSNAFIVVYQPPSGSNPNDGEAPTLPTPTTPFTLDVTSPGADSVTSQNPAIITGTLSQATGEPTVRWSNARGFTGTAVVTLIGDGKYRWEANPVSLVTGVNVISIRANDESGHSAPRTIQITYDPAPPTDPGADNTPPRIRIVSPTTTFLMTSAYSVAVRGVASDASGISQVRWECTCGSQGIAQGTTRWTVSNIALPVGVAHTIKITATDAAGNEGVASFKVFRYEN